MKFERLANPEEVTENADNQTDGESDMESESISGTNATSSSSTHLRSTDHNSNKHVSRRKQSISRQHKWHLPAE